MAGLGGAPQALWMSPGGRSLAISLPDRLQVRDVEAGRLVWAMAQKAVRLEPGNLLYRNTRGVACYRAGRYREAIETLRADLEDQEDRFLAWDLYFRAMCYHRLGDSNRAREYRSWALRWSRDQKGLSSDDLHELSAIREEMEAALAR